MGGVTFCTLDALHKLYTLRTLYTICTSLTQGKKGSSPGEKTKTEKLAKLKCGNGKGRRAIPLGNQAERAHARTKRNDLAVGLTTPSSDHPRTDIRSTFVFQYS